MNLSNMVILPNTIDLSQPINLSITAYNTDTATGINVSHNKALILELSR